MKTGVWKQAFFLEPSQERLSNLLALEDKEGACRRQTGVHMRVEWGYWGSVEASQDRGGAGRSESSGAMTRTVKREGSV